MLILVETSAGYALFKVLNEKKLKNVDNIFNEFTDATKANEIVKLKAFYKFESTAEAMSAAASLVESKLGKELKKFIKKNIVKKELTDELGVLDTKLGGVIKDKLGVQCVNDSAVAELQRGIRSQLVHLVEGLDEAQLHAMQLGLAHTLSRYKLKFSPDKVDTMIVQAVGLLDDLDKEVNTYAMRVKEWFGWHFPEMAKIVVDNLQYAQTVLRMGTRGAIASLDFSDILAPEVEEALKEAAQVSMGTDISPEDVASMSALAEQVVGLMEYRRTLWEYLQNRMQAIAPNLSVMLGELVGARLIAHAGSLLNLAKQPASTVQILGAEKALFRALKTKHDTPKYGLIYHASLVGQAAPKHKGKISRVLAAKTALSIRVDALGDSSEPTVAIEARGKVEARLRQLEGGARAGASGGAKARVPPSGAAAAAPASSASAGRYNPAGDFTAAPLAGSKRRASDAVAAPAGPASAAADADPADDAAAPASHKSSKKKARTDAAPAPEPEPAAEEDPAAEAAVSGAGSAPASAKKAKKEKKEKKEKKAKKEAADDDDE